MVLLIGSGFLKVDEMRRAIEALHPTHYASWGYYEKWAAGTAPLAAVICFPRFLGYDGRFPYGIDC